MLMYSPNITTYIIYRDKYLVTLFIESYTILTFNLNIVTFIDNSTQFFISLQLFTITNNAISCGILFTSTFFAIK